MSDTPVRPPSPYIVREFNDRGTLWLLEDPASLQEFIRILDASLAEELDFTQAQRINRSFIAADLQKLESDLVYRVPYRAGESAVLVYVLLEQQTQPDDLMPLRLLSYCGELWAGQVREWKESRQPAQSRRLSPVIPIVFYTGRERWDEEIALANLMDLPAPLRRFVPSWETLFLNLQQAPPEMLTQFSSAVGWALRALQAERVPLPELERILKEAMAGLEGLSADQAGQWKRCAWFLIQLVYHRRSSSEAPGLMSLVRTEAKRSKFHDAQEEVAMQSYAEYLNEIGEARGEARGERRMLLRQGTALFGPPDAETLVKLEAIQSLEVLEEIGLRVVKAKSWAEVLHDL